MIERGAIYLVQSGKLVSMEQHGYADESELQAFLASHPKLLAGEQMTPDAPRRWLLIRRELAIPDAERAAGRWSVDHLFVDQEATPTLVEVKRASDTRIRREVVGQMLDYAANAVAFSGSERFETLYERTCVEDGVDPAERLDEFLQGAMSPDAFWEQARTNLQAGRIRMVFVADEIPTELRQIVRFLQWQLEPAEVYAVEVPQYRGEGLTALVPRLVTESAAETTKRGSHRFARWTPEGFFERIASLDTMEQAVARGLFDWGEQRGLRMSFGRGKTPSFGPKLDHDGIAHHTFNVYADGWIEIPFGALHGVYEEEEARTPILDSLNKLGMNIPPDGISRYPRCPLKVLASGGRVAQFTAVWDEYLETIRESPS